MTDQTETFEHTVSILAIYREECIEKLTKLAKRGARYGQAISWTETPRTEQREFTGPNGKPKIKIVEWIDLAITGEAPRVGDYTFEAALERTSGGVIISAAPGINVGKLGREWDGRCDHCGSNRHRVHGYVVRKGKTVRKIVGKACLRDYLGMDAPEKIAGRFAFLRDLDLGGDEDGGWHRFGGSWFDLTESLIMTARAAIKLYGWRKNDHDAYGWKTTLGLVRVADRIDRSSQSKEWIAEQRKYQDEIRAELAAHGDEYQAEAEAIVAWARAIKPSNDYLNNLKVALSGETVAKKHAGLAVSACAAYDRQKEVEAERKAEAEKEQADRQPSEWIGNPKERMTLELEFASKRVLPDNGFGASDLIKFFGPDDQVVTWISSSVPREIRNLEKGAKITATFTVKRHGEFRDVKETQVLRLKAA